MTKSHWKGINPTSSTHWQTLSLLKKQAEKTSINQLFIKKPQRASQLKYESSDITVDLSRNVITDEIIDALVALAEECSIKTAIDDLLSGKDINNTENRAAHHSRLRMAAPQDNVVNGTISQLTTIAKKLRSGTWIGFNGDKITDIVNIGIGGSDLGPRLAIEALTPYTERSVTTHFISNIDPADLYNCLEKLNPATTLFIVSSKTFTTLETLSNATTARQWLSKQGQSLENHFIAVTSSPERATEFGIAPQNILPMWDWVGGRYSLWSAIGLPIAIAIGPDNFRDLLAGAASMDNHFGTAPLRQNIPVLLGLLDIWHVNFWRAGSIAVLPYHHNLRQLPDYLQQLTMESNGKQVDREGRPVNYSTCPVFWGSAGTVGQHSFHQLLHQGTSFIPVDFILPLQSHTPIEDHQAQLVANCLSQSIALSEGKRYSEDELSPHKNIPGNRPSTLITMDMLSPFTLGALLALYEHRTFTASVIWNINAFDQWGVELGKQISSHLSTALSSNSSLDGYDPAIQSTVERFRKLQQK